MIVIDVQKSSSSLKSLICSLAGLMVSFFLRHVAGDKGAQKPCPDMQVLCINSGWAVVVGVEVCKHILMSIHTSSSKKNKNNFFMGGADPMSLETTEISLKHFL